MVFRVGKKYQQSVCGNSDHCARVLSRRGFLDRRAAAAGPVILATDTDRACAQTMRSTIAAGKFPADRAKRLSALSILITIVWSRCIRTSAKTPKRVSWKCARRAASPSAQRTWIPGQNRNQDGRCRYLTQRVPNRRLSTARRGRQRGLGGNRSPLYQQGSRPEGMMEPRRLWRSLL